MSCEGEESGKEALSPSPLGAALDKVRSPGALKEAVQFMLRRSVLCVHTPAPGFADVSMVYMLPPCQFCDYLRFWSEKNQN